MTFAWTLLLLLKSAETIFNDYDIEGHPRFKQAFSFRRNADASTRNPFDIKRPSRLDNLDAVERINGSLQISSTKAFGDFSMEKLQEITMEQRDKDIEVLIANNASFLKDHMLPLAENAAIQADDHFLLCERVKSILSKEIVIMIGSEKEPSCVLPHLPHELKKQHVYKYLGSTYSFTLSRFKRMAPCTIRFTYDVVKTTKGKPPQKGIRKIYYHRWETKKLPVEFDEILQLAMLYKPGKTLCVSERRKEVFSLIHMLVTYCRLLKEHIDFKDALQLHTEKCNGTILDRNELVYVMAVIMEWAYQSRSVTPELKEKHVEWCHSYAIMAKFMRKCPNIRLIHPDYLTKLDATVKKRVLQDGFASSPRFSPRESVAAKDPFRRKSTSDKKSEMKSVKAKDEKQAKAESEKKAAEEDKEFWTKQASEHVPLPLTSTKKDRIAV